MSRAAPRVAVLISGEGSNLQALLDAARAHRLGAEIAVVVSNRAGVQTSHRAKLITNTNVFPVITLQPRSDVVFAGGRMEFRVAATGQRPLGYQWQKNGSVLPNETNASLLFPTVRFADAGNYAVTVSNAIGTVPSSAATLGGNSHGSPAKLLHYRLWSGTLRSGDGGGLWLFLVVQAGLLLLLGAAEYWQIGKRFVQTAMGDYWAVARLLLCGLFVALWGLLVRSRAWPVARVSLSMLFRRKLFWAMYALALMVFLFFFFGQYFMIWAASQLGAMASRSAASEVCSAAGTALAFSAASKAAPPVVLLRQRLPSPLA